MLLFYKKQKHNLTEATLLYNISVFLGLNSGVDSKNDVPASLEID